MADLVLQDSLVDEYFKYKFNDDFNKSKTQKLLKYIHTFPLKRNHPLMQDPSLIGQWDGSDPLIEISDELDDIVLVESSRLKLMLIDRVSATTSLFTTINILNTNEKLQLKYGATYPNLTDKDKAQAHIKALLSDASWIKITDGYIAARSSWNTNKSLIQTLLPRSSINVTIVGADVEQRKMSLDGTQKNEIEAICPNWNNVSCLAFNTSNMHDRYIETNKVKILLSSGLYHLSTSSAKDFTYIIELK